MPQQFSITAYAQQASQAVSSVKDDSDNDKDYDAALLAVALMAMRLSLKVLNGMTADMQAGTADSQCMLDGKASLTGDLPDGASNDPVPLKGFDSSSLPPGYTGGTSMIAYLKSLGIDTGNATDSAATPTQIRAWISTLQGKIDSNNSVQSQKLMAFQTQSNNYQTVSTLVTQTSNTASDGRKAIAHNT